MEGSECDSEGWSRPRARSWLKVLCYGFSQPCVQGGAQVRLLREHGLSSLVTLLLHPRVPVQVVGGRVHAAPLPTTFLTTLKDQEATVAVGAASASARRHLTRVEDQLRSIGALGKALRALVVSRWRKAAEKAVASLVRLLKGIFEDPFGTAQRRGAWLLLLDEETEQSIGIVFVSHGFARV